MKYVFVILAVLFACSFAYADQTGTSFWHSHSYTDNDSYIDRYNEYQKRQAMPLGLGLDTTIYEFDGVLNQYGLDSVNVEYKYDMANNNQEVYGVVHVNAWRAIKDLIK